MQRPIKEGFEKEIVRAITADEQANAYYYHTLRRFISGDQAESEATLDYGGLKAIDAAWVKLNYTNRLLRRAYMKLYSANLSDGYNPGQHQ